MSIFQNSPFQKSDIEDMVSALGELVFAWGQLETIIRAFEIKSTGGNYKPSNSPFGRRVDTIFGKKNGTAKELKNLAKHRNFVFHNPLAGIKKQSDETTKPVIIHHDMFASIRAQSDYPNVSEAYTPPKFGNSYIGVSGVRRLTDQILRAQSQLSERLGDGKRKEDDA